MTRAQLEHLIGSAATISDDDEIVVLGSQAILGQYPDAPADLLVSTEADLYPRNHPERADLIDGSIGELSPFHDTFGYYARGGGVETATLPEGWKDRLVPVRSARTRGATGWCLEAHDLVISKLVAGRDKDRRYVGAAACHGLVVLATLRQRLDVTPLAPEERAIVERRLEALCAPGA
jgi:hypothetical protein